MSAGGLPTCSSKRGTRVHRRGWCGTACRRHGCWASPVIPLTDGARVWSGPADRTGTASAALWGSGTGRGRDVRRLTAHNGSSQQLLPGGGEETSRGARRTTGTAGNHVIGIGGRNSAWYCLSGAYQSALDQELVSA